MKVNSLQSFKAFDVVEKGAWEELPGGSAALRLRNLFRQTLAHT